MNKPRCRISAIPARRGLLLVLAALLLAVPSLRGGEEDLYAQLLRRYDKVNAELQNVLADVENPYVPEYPDRMLSLRKNAGITIGGEVRTTYAASRAKWKDPGLNPGLAPSLRNNSKMGDLSVSSAKLLVDIRAGDRWRAFFDLDLHGYHGYRRIGTLRNVTTDADPNPVYERDRPVDILNQAYIELLKDGHSGFGFMAGLIKLPFGLWTRPNLFAQSYMDAPDLNGSYLMSPQSWDDAVRLPHASRFIDPAAAAMLTYELRDIIRFEAALFQEQDRERHIRSLGQDRYRSESHVPRSWQVGFSILPLEGWELTAHFRNRYSRTRGLASWVNSPSRWDFGRNLVSGGTNPSWDPMTRQWTDSGSGPGFGARTNEQSFIVGLAVEIPNTKLAVSAEYAHGWNQGFNKYINSDGVNVGLSYRLTPLLTLHAQGEWLHVKDRSWMAETAPGHWERDSRNNRLYRTLIGAEYELARGVTLEAGWQYEYWKITSSMGGAGGTHDDRLNTANMFYIGSRFIF